MDVCDVQVGDESEADIPDQYTDVKDEFDVGGPWCIITNQVLLQNKINNNWIKTLKTGFPITYAIIICLRISLFYWRKLIAWYIAFSHLKIPPKTTKNKIP